MCDAALNDFGFAHVEGRYDGIDDSRKDPQSKHYVVQQSSCLLVRLFANVVYRTQRNIQAASYHLQHKRLVITLTQALHQCGTSVVGSSAYLQATLCGLTVDATYSLSQDPRYRRQQCFVYGCQAFPACPSDSIKMQLSKEC